MKRRVAIAKRANGDQHVVWRNRDTNATEEKMHAVNDLADNEVLFRGMDLLKVSAEHGVRL